MDVANDRNTNGQLIKDSTRHQTKFEIYGDVLIEKTVNANGRGGRIYLPPGWVGKKVKIIKCTKL